MAYPLAWGDGLAVMVAVPHPEGVLGLHMPALGWTAIVALVVLPAAVLSGIQFPLLVALLGQGRRDGGQASGQGLRLEHGRRGVRVVGGRFRLVALADGARGLAGDGVYAGGGGRRGADSYRCGASGGRAWLAVPAAAIAAALVMASLPGPTAAWRHSGIGAGRATLTDADANSVRAWLNFNRRATIWEAEGVEASIAIRRDAGLSFYVNGKCDGNSLDGRQHPSDGRARAAQSCRDRQKRPLSWGWARASRPAGWPRSRPWNGSTWWNWNRR